LLSRHGARLVLGDAGVGIDGTGSDPERLTALVAELRQRGGEVVEHRADIATSEGSRGLAELAVERFGRIDAWINLAGIARDSSLLRAAEADFDSVLRTNLKATFLCTQAAANVMKGQLHGRIVNTTSTAGLLGNFGQTSATAAAAGVYGLTRTASIELQRFKIRVNAVAPLAKTRQTAELPMFEKVDSMRPQHVAPAYLFLASALSGDTTGVVMSVAGGRLSVTKLAESVGQFKDADDGVWTAAEIAEHFSAIRKGQA
jgi:NAD(P)-dependent dehydrogenase (short-subunit alcohol dehydrogenase family)